MRILVCKTFGIGNALMSIPSIKALKSLGHSIDVLVGDTHDDAGAFDVFKTFKQNFPHVIDDLYNFVPKKQYDLVLLSIPYDGRWNGCFDMSKTADGRTRPDPATVGLVSWEKSELEYQLDNARALGWSGETPSSAVFNDWQIVSPPSSYYFGIGYKKDAKNFWSAKHWGTENYIKLAKIITEKDPCSMIYMTGDEIDLKTTIAPILKEFKNSRRMLYVPTTSISMALKFVSNCETYVGNDTGMMHAAAAADRNVVGMFFLENSMVKNPPACKNFKLLGYEKPSPEEVYDAILEVRNARK